MGHSPPSARRILLFSVGVVCSKATPWGPRVLLPIIEKAKRTVPGLLINTWYLDDGTLCGSTTDPRATFEIIEVEGPLRGLSFKRGKSQPSLTNAFPPSLQFSCNQWRFYVVGVPSSSCFAHTVNYLICTTDS